MYRVLVVDDEKLVVESIKRGINWNDYGYEIIGEAYDGAEALEKIGRLMPDVVFTDIRMPEMDGIELIKEGKLVSKETQFVIVSGYSEFEYAQKAITYGAVGYCLKPVDELEIVNILNKIKSILQESKTAVESRIIDCCGDGTVKHKTIKSILEYVKINFLKDISIQTLSEEFYVNPSYVSRLFKKELGKTFTEYLSALRIEHACSLFEKTDLSIAEIAEKSGYDDYFYFNKVFKKFTGKTPYQYRNGS